MLKKLSNAFSLTELIIVLVIIGLVIAIGLPSLNKARADSEREAVRAKAVALQNAKMSLITALGHDNAQAQWTSTATATADETRYETLLRQYLPATYPAYLNTTTTASGTSLFSSDGVYSILLDGNGTVNRTGNIDNVATLLGPDPVSGNTVSIPLQKY